MIVRPVVGPLVSPITGALTGLRRGGLSSFSVAKRVVEQQDGDANILIIGDSTGNESTEWVYLFSEWLATQYPTHSVDHAFWNDETGAYGTPTSLSTGTGPFAVHVWNASVGGSTPRHLMGSKFAAAVVAAKSGKGQNLIANGRFRSDADGWMLDDQGGTATARWSPENGGSLALGGSGSLAGVADVSVPTVPGVTYTFSFEAKSNSIVYRIGTTRGGNDLVAAATLAKDTPLSVGFVATADTTWVRLQRGSVTTVGYADNVALRGPAESPNLIVWNHGHNILSASPPPDAAIKGDYVAAIETVRSAHPRSANALVLQNPRRDDDDMEAAVAFVRDIRSDYGDMAAVDAYSRFISAGKDASLYTDNVHPNAAGMQLFLQAAQEQWNRARSVAFNVRGALTATTAPNLLANGDFSAFDGAVPDGWNVVGTPTITKDAAEVDGDDAHSVKMVDTLASGRVQQDIGADELALVKGGKVTLAVRQYVHPTSPSSAGRLGISVTAGAVTTTTDSGAAVGYGGWRWRVISGVDVPSDATRVRVMLYCNTSAGVASTVYFGRAVLVAGGVPRDMA